MLFHISYTQTYISYKRYTKTYISIMSKGHN